MRKSYGQILKSSALIGGSSVLVIAVGIVRTKVMAVLLGTGGFGLMGLYTSILDLVVALAGMGINASGVRQVAEAASTGDEHRVARTAAVLRYVALALGLLGAGLLALFGGPVSTLTFGTDQHAWAVAVLSLAVMLRLIADARSALIQGSRRIADLAKNGVIGALFGTIVAIPLVYVLREEGVAPALVCMSLVSALTAWWYSRRIAPHAPALTLPEMRTETAALLKLGFVFMISAFLMMAASYAVRMMLARLVGLEAAGLYAAAWTLGGLYVNFVLQAMGADFYPRLVGVARNDEECNRLTNEQAQVSMLLAAPGVSATIVLAPVVIAIFYSSQFAGAVDTLRWICLGIAMRVITWPMGYIIVAKGRQVMLLISDVSWAAINIGLTWLFIRHFGLEGAGMAFFASYVCHGIIVYPMVRALSGFRWSRESLQTGAALVLSVSAVLCVCYALPWPWTAIVGVAICGASAAYSAHRILSSVLEERVPERLQKLLNRLRIASWYAR